MAGAAARDAIVGAAVRMNLRAERGTTLIETTIASAILLVVMVGLLSMAALATTYTENHGHLEARTTEYAQDKMEQLLGSRTAIPAATPWYSLRRRSAAPGSPSAAASTPPRR